MPGVFLVLVGFVGCDKTAAVSMLVLSLAFNSFTLAGPAPALFDIAPLYAGKIIRHMRVPMQSTKIAGS